jgi:hypothetical protein
MLEDVKRHAGSAPQSDDLVLVVIALRDKP